MKSEQEIRNKLIEVINETLPNLDNIVMENGRIVHASLPDVKTALIFGWYEGLSWVTDSKKRLDSNKNWRLRNEMEIKRKSKNLMRFIMHESYRTDLQYDQGLVMIDIFILGQIQAFYWALKGVKE